MTPLAPATVQHDAEGREYAVPGGIGYLTAPNDSGVPITAPAFPDDDPPAVAPAEDPDPAPTTPAPASAAVAA